MEDKVLDLIFAKKASLFSLSKGIDYQPNTNGTKCMGYLYAIQKTTNT